MDEGLVKREDLFITSKLWNTNHAREHVVPAFERSLNDMGLEYLDLCKDETIPRLYYTTLTMTRPHPLPACHRIRARVHPLPTRFLLR